MKCSPAVAGFPRGGAVPAEGDESGRGHEGRRCLARAWTPQELESCGHCALVCVHQDSSLTEEQLDVQPHEGKTTVLSSECEGAVYIEVMAISKETEICT